MEKTDMTNSLQTTSGTASPRRQRSGKMWPCSAFPVRTPRDHARAIGILNRIVGVVRPTREMRDFMDIMLPVVGDYEDRHHHGLDTSGISPLDLLRSLMEDQEMNAADLGRLLGNRSLGSAILRGDRQLSKAHIKILAERFKLSPAAFI